jgi:hypothetical protein
MLIDNQRYYFPVFPQQAARPQRQAAFAFGIHVNSANFEIL